MILHIVLLNFTLVSLSCCSVLSDPSMDFHHQLWISKYCQQLHALTAFLSFSRSSPGWDHPEFTKGSFPIHPPSPPQIPGCFSWHFHSAENSANLFLICVSHSCAVIRWKRTSLFTLQWFYFFKSLWWRQFSKAFAERTSCSASSPALQGFVVKDFLLQTLRPLCPAIPYLLLVIFFWRSAQRRERLLYSPLDCCGGPFKYHHIYHLQLLWFHGYF